MVNNLNWQTDQLTIYKCHRGVELEAAKKQLQLAAMAGLELGTSGSYPNCLATLLPGWQRGGDSQIYQ